MLNNIPRTYCLSNDEQGMKVLPWLLCVLISPGAFAQILPQIDPGGLVNAASYAQPISPGAIVSIFGRNLASTQATAQNAPLPPSLAGTSVTINGTVAPLFYVSPTQINLQVPWSTQWFTFSYTPASVVVTTPAGSSTPVQVAVYGSSPSFFSQDGSGCGQAAVLNLNPDGSVSVNSPSNSAAPGDYISLYGTGIGLPMKSPADGTFSAGLAPLQSQPGIDFGGNPVNVLLPYAGLAPSLVGVDQINVQIPEGTPEGCAVPVSVRYGQFGFVSPTMSISIHSGRGQCVDRPTQSFGSVTLTKTVTSGTAGVTNADTLSANFPSGPGVRVPEPPAPSQPGSYSGQIAAETMSRSCAVNGSSQLSAGTLTVLASSSGQATVAQPIPATGGVEYQESLPDGFIAPSRYTVLASGNPVQFHGTLTIPPSIQILTSLTPGTQVSVSHNFVIDWTGGTAGELVKVSFVASKGLFSSVSSAYIDASAGSFTFSPFCTGSPKSGFICVFGVLLSYPMSADDLSVEVEVLPSSGYSGTVSAEGLTQGVQLSWMYRYIFNGLTFAP